MTRVFLGLLFLAVSLAQAQPPPPPVVPAEPEEEEPAAKPKEYELNPLQADNEIRIGRYYMKKHSFRAAAGRFDEATKWNPASSEAFLMLGEAREKLKDSKAAKAAYAKYLQLAPDAKMAEDVKKRMEKLGK